jgi:replicative DNA helicase
LDEVALLRSGETQSGLATGFEKLDELIVLRPGNMVVVAGRPAMGKTAFALAMGDAQLPEAKSVAIFSLEMSTTEMVCRLLSLQSGIVGNDIRTGRLTDAQFEHLQFIKDELKDKKLFIDDTAYKTVAQIKNRARYLQHKYGLDLIIIDYIQLLGEAADENRVQEVSHITRSIKMLAKELRIPVIALSQLSRAVEMRNNKRPVLSDLRESGSIEQDADIVMFVYRDEYYNPETLYRCCAEIIVAKNRHGNCGTAMLGFKGSTTEFFNLKEAVNV